MPVAVGWSGAGACGCGAGDWKGELADDEANGEAFDEVAGRANGFVDWRWSWAAVGGLFAFGKPPELLDMPVALPTSMDARKGLVCWLGCRPVCIGCRPVCMGCSPPPVWKLATES